MSMSIGGNGGYLPRPTTKNTTTAKPLSGETLGNVGGSTVSDGSGGAQKAGTIWKPGSTGEKLYLEDRKNGGTIIGAFVRTLTKLDKLGH